MNIYLQILKPLLKQVHFKKYYSYLNLDTIEKNYPDIYRLYKSLGSLHKEDKDYSVDDLKVALFTLYPKVDEQQYARLLEALQDSELDETLLVDYIHKAAQRDKALQIARLAIQASEGIIPFEEVTDRFSTMEEASPVLSDWRESVVSSSIRALYENTQAIPGLRWRLASLNQALGSLRKGNFGFVFARPETGKTTFLASELTFMAAQVKEEAGPIVWFNNEQAGADVQERISQATLGVTREILYKDLDGNDQQYNAVIRGKLILIDNASFNKRDIEGILKELKPSLIVFDQIDNLKGFKADRPDLEFKEIYQWARELAKQYGPVIGVCQAGGTGEDKKWLTMNDVDSSKTSKQGAADWILGIGKIHEQGYEQVRFLHLSKNKLPGDKDSDGRERHGRWQVLIRPEIARYSDM